MADEQSPIEYQIPNLNDGNSYLHQYIDAQSQSSMINKNPQPIAKDIAQPNNVKTSIPENISAMFRLYL